MEENKNYRSKIENYIEAYNSFNVEKMLKDLHEDVIFRNVANGEMNLSIQGIEAFKNQAEMAKTLFQEREQKIETIKLEGDTVEIEIDYTGILTKDIPHGPKAGETVHLKGKSIFVFEDDKILSITDIS